jgi:hypothetical protein
MGFALTYEDESHRSITLGRSSRYALAAIAFFSFCLGLFSPMRWLLLKLAGVF